MTTDDLREFYEGSGMFDSTPFDDLTRWQISRLQCLYRSMKLVSAAYAAAEIIKKYNDKDLFRFIERNMPGNKKPKRSKIIKRIKK